MRSAYRGRFSRRRFIQTAASLGALGVGSAAAKDIALVFDPSDPIAASGPVQWAMNELADSLAATGILVRRYERASLTPAGSLCIVASRVCRPRFPKA